MKKELIELLSQLPPMQSDKDIEALADEILALFDVVESAELVAANENGTPLVDEHGAMTCNCAEPKQSSFPNGKWICLKCWGEWYH